MPDFLPIGENRLLKRLRDDDRSVVLQHLKSFNMVQGAVLHRPMQEVDYVYFPLSGMISLLAVMKTGDQIETAIVGREGVVGGSIGSFNSLSFGQATVQLPGTALRMAAEPFQELFHASPRFRAAINEFQSVIFLQAQQSAACHALHTVEQRLCRWILQSEDVVGSTEIRLTQEFLSHMLGVHRPAVSLAATALQTRGLIQYTRGKITILNRGALEKKSCECYAVVQGHMNRMGVERSKLR